MRRREFVVALGGAAAWPLGARAQQRSMPVIGILFGGTSAGFDFKPAYRAGLNEYGYIEGQTVAIEYLFAEGRYERLSELAADLVGRNVNVIVAAAPAAALAAKMATSAIPIVFVIGNDPLRLGLVASLNRPGGNVTGAYFLIALAAKQLALLHEIIPTAAKVAFLVNPEDPDVEFQTRDAQAAAQALGTMLMVLNVRTVSDFEPAFAAIAQQRAGALLVSADAFFNSERDRIVRLAARYAIPTIYSASNFAVAGGLASYGANIAEAQRQGGVYAGRILKGAKPADLPVVQASKFELVINLKTAKTLGIEVPSGLSARADEVIE